MRQVWHIATDLMMSSTVKIAATKYGLEYRAIPNPMQLSSHPIHGEVVALIIDLQTPGLDLAYVKTMIDAAALPNLVVLMYAQHVNEEALARGATLGSGQVMTRGQFNRNCDSLIAALQA